MKPRTTQLCPPPGDGLTPCCAKAPTALPIGDRITLQLGNVTCKEQKK